MRHRVPSPKRVALRLLVGTLALVFCAGMALFLVGNRVYAHPRVDALRPADAILVIGGPGWDRFPFAMDLAKQGWAPNLVISTAIGPKDTGLWDYCHREGDRPFAVYCFTPDPVTTRGEAQQFRKLADEHHWQSVIVVTFRPHNSRARFIIEKCFSGRVTMVQSPAQLSRRDWIYQYFYQTAGFIKAALSSGC